MALPGEDQDPMASIIAERRMDIKAPTSRSFGTVNVHDIDLDHLALVLNHWISHIYACNNQLINRIGNEAAITESVKVMVDLSLLICYNRLRAIAQSYSISTFTQHMNVRAPVSSTLEFPAFLASTLGSIGPLRLIDDSRVIYAPSTDRMANYGRAHASPDHAYGLYDRLIQALRSIKVQMATIIIKEESYDYKEGSFFTTLVTRFHDYRWSVEASALHRSRYDYEDVARCFLTAAKDEDSEPFAQVCSAANAVREGDEARNSTADVVREGDEAKNRGAYSIDSAVSFSIARNIHDCDIYDMLRYRLLRS